MANGILDQLTLSWYYDRASLGVLGGYPLRWSEHIVWATDPKNNQSRLEVLRWGLMSEPQCILFGVAGGYVLTAFAANSFHNATIIGVCAYGNPAMTSFLTPTFGSS